VNERRGPWYLITGLVLGVLLGLAIAWLVRPPDSLIPRVKPDALQESYKDRYRAMIALAYQADGDLVRARARLELLKDTDVFRALAGQAQRAQAVGTDESRAEAEALGLLAGAISAANVATPASLPTPFATFIITPTLNIPAAP
jgi:hypothetical protein